MLIAFLALKNKLALQVKKYPTDAGKVQESIIRLLQGQPGKPEKSMHRPQASAIT
jgi:hypothetical protein